jgi:hypothetical protein
MNVAGVNIDGSIIKDALNGVGDLATKIRSAITGDMSPGKKAELEQLAMELENKIEISRLSIMTAEASSQDKWTSRARPAFLYVMYIYVLVGIPMGIVSCFDPTVAANLAKGCGAWLHSIPPDMWVLFGAGYLGYVGARSWDKKMTNVIGGGK